MRPSPRVLPLLLLLAFPGAAWAEGNAVVLPIVASGVDSKVSNNLTSLISSELDFSGAFDSVSDIPAPGSLNASCLTSAKCLGAIARENDAQAVVAGSVSTGGAGLKINLVIYDAGKNAIVRKKSYDIASDVASLAGAAPRMAKELLGQGGSAAVEAESGPGEEAFGEEEDFAFDKGNDVKGKTKFTPEVKKGKLEDADEEEDEDEDAAAEASRKRAEAEAKLKAEARAKADAEARARAAAEAALQRAKAEAEAKAKAAAQAKARAAAEAAAAAAAEEEEERAAAKAAAARKKSAPVDDEEEDEEPSDEDLEAELAAFSFGGGGKVAAAAEAEAAAEDSRPKSFSERYSSGGSDKQAAEKKASTSSSRTTASRARVTEEEEEEEPEEEVEEVEEEEAPRASSKARTRVQDEEEEEEEERPKPAPRSRVDDNDDDEPIRRAGNDDGARARFGVAVRGGYARYGTLDFVTYGAEFDIPVASRWLVLLGVEGASTNRNYTDEERAVIATAAGILPEQVQDWNAILPINVGVVYKVPTSSIQPYVGADALVVAYTAKPDFAFGGRLRGGCDFMLSDTFGFNLDVGLGILSGDQFDLIQAGLAETGFYPEVSGGTMLAF